MSAQALAFNGIKFDVIARSGQPWLGVTQIGLALGYKSPETAVTKIYNRNAEEFTESMTAIVDIDTKGGKQKVRVFSMRGCHLLAMFARTKVAKSFRKWVLDILDKHGPEIDLPISAAQQSKLREIVEARVTVHPKESWPRLFSHLWRLHNRRFDIAKYNQLPSSEFDSAVAFLESAPLDGEFLPASESHLMTKEQNTAIVSLIKSKMTRLSESDMPDCGFDIYAAIQERFGEPYSKLPSAQFDDVLRFVAELDIAPPGDRKTLVATTQRFLTVIEGNEVTKMRALGPKEVVMDVSEDKSLRTVFAEYLPVSKLPMLIRMATDRLELAAQRSLPRK